MLMEATKMYSSIDPPQPQAGPSSKPIRRCPQALCGHAIFPPNWKYGICPTCLEQFRNPTKAQQDEARSNASMAESHFRANNATTSTSRSADNNGYMSRLALVVPSMPPTVQLAQCYFCTTRIIVPIGHHPSSGPLVCETCFALAVVRHRELQRQQDISQSSRIPQQPVVPPAVPHLPTSYTTLSLPGPPNSTDAPPPQVTTASHQRRHSIVSVPPAACQSPEPEGTACISRSVRKNHEIEGNTNGAYTEPTTVIPIPNDDINLDGLVLQYPEDDAFVQDSSDFPMLDGTMDAAVEGSNALLPHSQSYDAPEDWGSMSELTELSDLDSDSDSDSSDDVPLSSMHPNRPSGLKIRLRIPPGFRFDQQPRICAHHSCNLPVKLGSQWKLCDSCRARYRQYQRQRLGIKRPRLDTGEDAQMLGDDKVIPDLGPNSRKCSVKHCHRPLPPEGVYHWKLCSQCRTRSRAQNKRSRAFGILRSAEGKTETEIRRDGGLARYLISNFKRQSKLRKKLGFDDTGSGESKIENSADGGRDLDPNASDIPDVKVPEAAVGVKSPTTSFQDLSELLRTMRAYLSDFLHAQLQYISLRKLKDGSIEEPLEPFIFSFDGEFSICAQNALKTEQTLVRVAHLMNEVRSTLAIEFKPMAPPILREGELIAPFACMHTFALPIPVFDSDILQTQQKEEDEQVPQVPASSSEQVAKPRVMSEPPCSLAMDAEDISLRSRKHPLRFASAPPSIVSIMPSSTSTSVLDVNEVDQSLGAESISDDPPLSSTPSKEPPMPSPTTPLEAKPVTETMLPLYPSPTSPIIPPLQPYYSPIPGSPVAVAGSDPSTFGAQIVAVGVSDGSVTVEGPSEIVSEVNANVERHEQPSGSPRSNLPVLPPAPDNDSDSDSSSEEPLARRLKSLTTKAKDLTKIMLPTSTQSYGHGPIPEVLSSPTSQTILLPRKLSGELEIRVAGDWSHPFLAGQRTTVRLRLLG